MKSRMTRKFTVLVIAFATVVGAGTAALKFRGLPTSAFLQRTPASVNDVGLIGPKGRVILYKYDVEKNEVVIRRCQDNVNIQTSADCVAQMNDVRVAPNVLKRRIVDLVTSLDVTKVQLNPLTLAERQEITKVSYESRTAINERVFLLGQITQFIHEVCPGFEAAERTHPGSGICIEADLEKYRALRKELLQFGAPLVNSLKKVDQLAADLVDRLIASSRLTTLKVSQAGQSFNYQALEAFASQQKLSPDQPTLCKTFSSGCLGLKISQLPLEGCSAQRWELSADGALKRQICETTTEKIRAAFLLSIALWENTGLTQYNTPWVSQIQAWAEKHPDGREILGNVGSCRLVYDLAQYSPGFWRDRTEAAQTLDGQAYGYALKVYLERTGQPRSATFLLDEMYSQDYAFSAVCPYKPDPSVRCGESTFAQELIRYLKTGACD